MLGLRNFISLSCKRTVVANAFAAAPMQMTKIAPAFTAYNRAISRNFMTLPSTSFCSVLASKVPAVSKESVPFTVRQMSSLMKKRRSKMNKHKLKKRRKSLKFNTKQSRA